MIDRPLPVVGDADLIGADTIGELAGQRPPCVSVLQPTHRAGAGTQQDPIRFANLLRSAERALVDEEGMPAREAASLLDPARALGDDALFWRHQSDGLAVYLAPGFMRAFRLPLALAEEAVVGRSFRVRPLLPLLSGDGHFFVLAVSLNQVRLYEATRFTIDELTLGPIPGSMAEALAHEDPEAQLQVRSGGKGGVYHGHGVGDEIDKQALERFFRAVDRGLRARLGPDPAPLVLAAVAYYLPIFRSVTTHPALAGAAVEGSPDGLAPRDLHPAAWEIVAPLFASARGAAEERLQAAIARARAAVGAREVVEAAATRRVDTLFLADGAPGWGRLRDSSLVELHEERQAGDDDLLEWAAAATLAAGGSVYLEDVGRGTEAAGGRDAPEQGVDGAAALLRW